MGYSEIILSYACNKTSRFHVTQRVNGHNELDNRSRANFVFIIPHTMKILRVCREEKNLDQLLSTKGKQMGGLVLFLGRSN